MTKHRMVNTFIYRKIPVISPGLIQLRNGFGWAYKGRGLYPRGLINGIKKKTVSKRATVVLIEIRF